MADLDKLQIKISASSSEASQAIDTLIGKLKDLNRQLGLGDATKFTEAITRAKKNLDGFSKAAPDLSKVTSSINNIGASASKTGASLASLSDKTKELFKGIQGEKSNFGIGEQSIDEMAEFTKGLSEIVDKNPDIEEAGNALDNLGKAAQKLPKPDSAVMPEIKPETPKKIKETSAGSKDLLANLVVLGHELKKVSAGFDSIANKGISAMKLLYTPLIVVGKEFKEKFANIGAFFAGIGRHVKGAFANMGKAVTNFKKQFQDAVSKMTAFWKRAMRTFSFMIVRKAFTAVIQNIKEATDSLAQFSALVGTSFNENISNAIANFQWLARAIVGAFEPLINYIVPIFNIISEKLVELMTKIGEFFAALTGQQYYMIAKKNIKDYAESLKKTEKQAKSNIATFDKLNIITTPKDTSAEEQANPLLEWDMAPVSKKVQDFAKKVKDIFNDLFEPLKKAWDRAGKYVTDGFKYMIGQFKNLFKDLGKDFLEVWQQEKTVKLFETLLRIVGDLERVIGNIVKRFDEAWKKNQVGKQILENIRDILLVIATHIRSVTEYMIGWSNSLDFYPILEAFKNALQQMEDAVDKWGYVFEDVMKDLVFPMFKYLLERVAPEVIGFIGDVIEGIGNIGANIHEAWTNLDFGRNLFEKITAIVDVLLVHVRNIGDSFKEWTKGISFEPLMNSILKLMDSLKPVADAIGGVFEDIFGQIEKYIEHMIEEGIPHFINAVSEILNAFDWEGLREKLKPLEAAIENLIENIHEGVTNAFKNVGTAIAEFINSDNFTKFLQRLSDLMAEVTAERVEKVLTALAKAIINVADAVLKFVNSDAFMDFMKGIGNWLDKHSDDDLAGILAGIAAAIAGFKFTAFAAAKMAGFIQFLSVVSSAKNIASILSGLGGGAGAAAGGLSAFAASAGLVVGVLASATAAVYSFVESFGGVQGAIDQLQSKCEVFKEYVTKLLADFGITEQVNVLVESFKELTEALGNMTEFWKVALDVIGVVVGIITGALTGALSGLITVVTGAIEVATGFVNILGGIGEAFMALVNGDMPAFEEAVNRTVTGVERAFTGLVTSTFGLVEGLGKGIYGVFAQLKYQLIGDPIVIDLVNGIIKAFTDGANTVIQKITDLKNNVVQKFTELKTNISQKLSEIKSFIASYSLIDAGKKMFNTLWNGMKEVWSGISSWLGSVVDKIKSAFDTVKSVVNSIKDAVASAKSAAGSINIRGFASGGYPMTGTLFYANERGPELVGTMNGRTAVAPNNEITGITSAINSTSAQEIELLRQQNQLLSQILQKEFGISSGEVYKAVRREDNIFRKATGSSGFAYGV